MLKRNNLPVLYFTVTTDLSYDQRMIRICTSLANAGYTVILVGRKKKDSIALDERPYQQKRISCVFEKGKFFYAEYNIRLFFFLLLKKMAGLCAIDLDTIAACYIVSLLKKTKRIYDAHELFCEMKEVVTRPRVYKTWKWIERHTVPAFKLGYTVNEQIAAEFKNMYGNKYEVIRNISLLQPLLQQKQKEKFILYQGAVNEGRSFETLIPAMQFVQAQLIICGNGNFINQAKKLVSDLQLTNKIIFKGMLQPALLENYTAKAYIGITLFEKESRSNYFSLANRFFDYIHAATPQLCVNYPVYAVINNQYCVAELIDELSPENIAKHLNGLLEDPEAWERLRSNCILAAKELNWQHEEKKLIQFYKNIFG